MQLFVWRWKGDSKLRTFAMRGLIMGTIPSASISSVAVHETASLDDHEERYPVAFEALSKKTYVDNTFVTGPNHEKVRSDIAEIELVAQKGGFF